MKIAIVSGWAFLPPYCGTRKLVYQTAINLGDSGHKVILIMATSESEKEKLRISKDNVDLELVPFKKNVFELYCIVALILGKIFDYVWAPFSNLIRSKILELYWLNSLYTKIELFDPDIIMAEDMYVAPAVSEVAKKLRLPFVYRIHHIYSLIYLHHPFQRILKKWELSVLRRADLLLALTYHDKEIVDRIFGLKPQIAECGIDLFNYNKEAKSFEFKEKEYVLYISSYLGKEVYWLRKAAALFPNTTFVFAGRGSLTSVKLPRNVKRLGIVTEQELALLYKYCKFVFIPIEWSPGRGFPIKLAEAFRSNKPILINKKACWLLPRNSPGIYSFIKESSLYKQIESLLNRNQTIRRDSLLFDWSIALQQLESQFKCAQHKNKSRCKQVS